MNIKINDYNWKIEVVDADDERLKIDNDEIFGLTNFKELKIFLVKEGMNKEVFKRTLRHELTHAYINSYGFIGYEMNEEYICNFVETYAEKIVEDTNYIYNELYKEEILEKLKEKPPYTKTLDYQAQS